MNREEEERNSQPARRRGAAITYKVLYLEEMENLPTSQKGETSSSVNTGKVDKPSPRCTFHAGKIFRVFFCSAKTSLDSNREQQTLPTYLPKEGHMQASCTIIASHHQALKSTRLERWLSGKSTCSTSTQT